MKRKKLTFQSEPEKVVPSGTEVLPDRTGAAPEQRPEQQNESTDRWDYSALTGRSAPIQQGGRKAPAPSPDYSQFTGRS